MRFDHFTVTLLELCPNPPQMDEAQADELQSAHLAHLADLHEQGLLIAAGPVPGPPGQVLRGFTIWTLPPEEVERRIAEHPDPAVAAGRLSHRVVPWTVPAGSIAAGQSRFPRSVDEAVED
jgi:uncharacterized protein